MKRLLVLVAVTLSVCVVGLIAGKSQEQKSKSQWPPRETKEQSRAHARSVYRGLLDPGKEKIPDVVAKWDRDLNFTIELGLPVLNPFGYPTLQQMLNERACAADAIVTGVVKAQTSRLTEDETFIYTIHELDVTSVLKDNPERPINPGEHINVLRTGGKLQIKGRKVTALYHAFLWLESEKTYLLFLAFVPEKGLYVSNNYSWELKDGKIVQLSKGHHEPELETGNDVNSTISLVRAAVAAPCDD